MRNFIKYILISICYTSIMFCGIPKKTALESADGLPKKQPDFNDPICGESVIWHLHLQDGFERDTIKFIVGTDTFPDYTLPDPSLIATTGGNDCTGIYFTCYKKEGESFVFLHNMPKYNTIRGGVKINEDSVKIGVLINGKIIDFSASLVYNRFFGINYNREYESIWAYKGKSCFACW